MEILDCWLTTHFLADSFQNSRWVRKSASYMEMEGWTILWSSKSCVFRLWSLKVSQVLSEIWTGTKSCLREKCSTERMSGNIVLFSRPVLKRIGTRAGGDCLSSRCQKGRTRVSIL